MKRHQHHEPAHRENPAQWETPSRLATHYGWLAIAAFALIGLGLRVSDLRADPPPDLSWSFAPYTDEGLNTYSARNLVLYGTWKTDDFLPFVIYPLPNMLVALALRLFGVGFVQLKLVSVLSGVLSILVMYLLLREAAGHLSGLLAGMGLATCYPIVMYSRLGLIETTQILFLLCAGLFWSKGLKRPGLMFFCGLFSAATILLVKLSAVFIAPVMLTLFVWELIDRRHSSLLRHALRRAFLWFVAGTIATATIWFLTVFLPYHGEYLRYVLRHSTESPAGHPHGPMAYLLNAFTLGMKARLLPRLLWPALIGFAALPFLAIGHHPGHRYLLLWMLFGLLMLGYMNYRPPRYEMILIPVLLAGFAAGLGRLVETGSVLPASRPGIINSLLLSLWFWPLATQLLLYASSLRSFPGPGAESGLLLAGLALALVMVFGGVLLLRSLPNGIAIRPRGMRIGAAVVLLFLTLRLDVGQFFSWFSNRTRNMISYSRQLDQALPDGAVVGGGWAPILLSESRKRALVVTDWANNDDPIGRYGVTHIASLEDGPDIKQFLTLYPNLASRLEVFRRFEVRGFPLVTYWIAPLRRDSIR